MTDEMFQNLGPKDEGSVAGGFLLGLGPGLIINLLSGCASLSTFNGHVPLLSILGGIAVGQLLFTLPFYRHFKSLGKPNTGRGLIIGASVSCLVGVTCGVALVSSGGF